MAISAISAISAIRAGIAMVAIVSVGMGLAGLLAIARIRRPVQHFKLVPDDFRGVMQWLIRRGLMPSDRFICQAG